MHWEGDGDTDDAYIIGFSTSSVMLYQLARIWAPAKIHDPGNRMRTYPLYCPSWWYHGNMCFDIILTTRYMVDIACN